MSSLNKMAIMRFHLLSLESLSCCGQIKSRSNRDQSSACANCIQSTRSLAIHLSPGSQSSGAGRKRRMAPDEQCSARPHSRRLGEQQPLAFSLSAARIPAHSSRRRCIVSLGDARTGESDERCLRDSDFMRAAVSSPYQQISFYFPLISTRST